uniref:Uncharacterized protein n=1 Tax=Meloidogyne enterolobii TaxID=390850 RepID=A0A6V7W405_MELEN|nr:unnamed protein product [Meloidogyne enterolobii]
MEVMDANEITKWIKTKNIDAKFGERCTIEFEVYATQKILIFLF